MNCNTGIHQRYECLISCWECRSINLSKLFRLWGCLPIWT